MGGFDREVNRLQDRIAELEASNNRLREGHKEACIQLGAKEAIVAKLPRSADDEPISLFDFLWRVEDGKKTRCQVDAISSDSLMVSDDGGSSDWYHYTDSGPWFYAEETNADRALDERVTG